MLLNHTRGPVDTRVMPEDNNHHASDDARGRPDPAAAPAQLDRLAVLVHELNNLLDGCLRCLASARTKAGRGGADPDTDHLLETVQAGLMQMAGLVHGATQSSGVPIGSSMLEPAHRRTLGETIAHAREVALASVGDDSIRIQVICEEGLSDLPAGPLYSAVLNGLINAVEAVRSSPREGVSLIELTASTVGGVLDLRVIDPGPGLEIDPDRALEPRVSTKGPGRGLGLAVSRELIEREGGSIELRDRGGHQRGVELRISVPIPADRGSVWIGQSGGSDD